MKAFSVEALCVFGIVFSLFLTITGVFTELPPGGSFFEGIWACIVNGVFYGLIVWLIYAVAVSFFGSKPEPTVRFEPKPVPALEVPVKIEEAKAEVQEELKVEPKAGIPIIDVEGIGEVYAKKLNNVGIFTTTHLLEEGGTKVGREELSEKTGISEKLILEWVNLSDLMRIKGVGEEYSDLLEEAGVDTVVELSRRNPDNLFAKIMEINEEKKLVRRPPTLDAVKSWVEQAKQLPRKVEY
jgi:predicted flap endonuclease-1-like 5' DNA nuclease